MFSLQLKLQTGCRSIESVNMVQMGRFRKFTQHWKELLDIRVRATSFPVARTIMHLQVVRLVYCHDVICHKNCNIKYLVVNKWF